MKLNRFASTARSAFCALLVASIIAPTTAQAGASATLKTRLDKLEKLEEARGQALGLIRDESRYNDSTKGTKVQDEVDQLVALVERAYRPVAKLLSSDLKRLSGRNKREQLVALMSAKVEGLNPWEKELRTYVISRQALKENEELFKKLKKANQPFSKEQFEQVLITNGYRMMMGEVALRIDLRLVAAAQGHSSEMTRLGYFSHNSPDETRRTPFKRAKLEGFDGTMTGENIAKGYSGPQAVHRGWCTSPGHHRNILAPEWDCMGVAPDADHWTQVFGRSAPIRG